MAQASADSGPYEAFDETPDLYSLLGEFELGSLVLHFFGLEGAKFSVVQPGPARNTSSQ